MTTVTKTKDVVSVEARDQAREQAMQKLAEGALQQKEAATTAKPKKKQVKQESQQLDSKPKATSLAKDAVKAAQSVKTEKTATEVKTETKPKPATSSKKIVDERKFRYAGVSRLEGKLRLRFTNNISQRRATFKRDGDEDIVMVDFDVPATKTELAKMMLVHKDFAGNQEALDLIKKLAE